MITGIGIDVTEIKRMTKHIDDQAFISRILTPEERRQFSLLGAKRKAEFLAGRFSAKEAYAKAKGTGLGANLSFQDLTVLDNSLGRPVMKDRTSPGAAIHISITHTDTAAASVAVIESPSC
ncbi:MULTISPECIES: holo-ACP synthase [unclassified Sporolactobacillus]|uniref:holo-ACP synthase n=1 Tax=unclassified Sporolactobacillus TaxID=2628533 RepID=UPI002367514D|nr:holo-ACP synthase [Sporolactobacillus sp. CQH2019]MDD9150756.1 holo-ACP synthase [Sporolactobacillus sp. CQH2019]